MSGDLETAGRSDPGNENPELSDGDVDFTALASEPFENGRETGSGQLSALADHGVASRPGVRKSAFMGVPIEVTVSIGRARPLVSELVKLHRDSVLTLDSKIDDPVEIYIGDRLIARGELQEMDDESGQLGVRLTEVADLSSGV